MKITRKFWRFPGPNLEGHFLGPKQCF